MAWVWDERRWQAFAYQGFSTEFVASRRPLWEEAARDVYRHLTHQNVVVSSGTSSGKTIIALLVILASGRRAVCFVPRVHLAAQHAELLRKLEGVGADHATRVAILTGDVPMAARVWHDPDVRIVFATAEAFMNDAASDTVLPGMFDLAVFDEVHHVAEGEHAYYRACSLMRAWHTPLLGLTATVGSGERRRLLEARFGKPAVLTPAIQTPDRSESEIIVPLDEPLSAFIRGAEVVLSDIAKELVALRLTGTRESTLSIEELEAIGERIEKLDTGDSRRYLGLTVHARYLKLLSLYRGTLSEGYHVFTEGFAALVNQDTTRAAHWLHTHFIIRQLAALARSRIGTHPKEQALTKNLTSLLRMHRTALVSVWHQTTAFHLARQLRFLGIRAAAVVGGSGRARRELTDAIERFRDGEFEVLVGTTVLNEGLNLPEVGGVVLYSMPMTETARAQTIGRTARRETGIVTFLALEHPVDQIFLWKTRAREVRDTMARIAARKRKNRSTVTLDLFEPGPVPLPEEQM